MLSSVPGNGYPVIILGSGGHARVLLDCLRLAGREIIGVTTHENHQIGDRFEGVPILGNDSALDHYSPQEIELVNGVGSVRVDPRREMVFENLKKRGYSFAQVIHPSAIIAASVVLHEGVQVMAGAILQPGSVIGMNTVINTRASIDHDSFIDSHVHVAPGSVLSGYARVGARSHIGTGAVVIQGVRIGESVLVAAGAVVIKDVADGQRVAGVPARELPPI